MKKKLLTLVLGLAVSIAVAPTAFAALTNSQKAEVDKLETEIAKLRKQVVQKYVDSGEITAEQGKIMQERIDAAQKYRTTAGSVYGPMGRGGCGGFGGKFGGGNGGCGSGGCGGNAGSAPTSPVPSPQSF